MTPARGGHPSVRWQGLVSGWDEQAVEEASNANSFIYNNFAHGNGLR